MKEISPLAILPFKPEKYMCIYNKLYMHIPDPTAPHQTNKCTLSNLSNESSFPLVSIKPLLLSYHISVNSRFILFAAYRLLR